ncbi:septation protein SepH [Actinomycetes bacterium KLBMP 9759]
MRALRVVGITEGGGEISVILEDPDRRERFTVPADEQLRAAARGDRTRLGQISIELESQLRPREIQARIRAGASVEQVASMAGVPLQKIERFAYPVLLERSRTAEVAQRAHPMRADGPDSRMLGDVVAHTFGLRGQEYAEAEWDSWKGEDGRWVVALSWRAGRSDNRAHWTFQPGAHGGTVTAVDEHASDLVEGLPARPLRTVGPVIDIARQEEPAPAPEPDAREELRATGSGAAPVVEQSRATAPVETARPPREAPPAPADPPAPRRAAPPAQRKAEPRTEPRTETRREPRAEPRTEPRAEPRQETRPEPRRETRTETRTETRAEPRRETRREPAPEPRQEPAAEQAPVEPQEEPAVEQPAEQPESAPAANRRTKKGKPVMPSWDEVLLGVRGQR